VISKLEFCEHFLRLRRERMRFDGRPYLPPIYASQGNLVLRSSRQSEKSTFLCNTLVYQFIFRPNTSSLLVCPRLEQARMFFRDRLQPAIEESPYVRRILLGKSGTRLQLSHTRFANGSSLFIRGAFRSADTVRGISADLLLTSLQATYPFCKKL
jgi:phage terminase large subunit GpA-like protein